MQRGNTDHLDYRFGDHGPAYVIQGPSSDIGVLRLRPGDDMTNHIHRFCDESFVVLEGSVTLWADCRDRYTLTVGDIYRCAPGDTVNLPWTPGQPAPQVPETPAS